MPPQAAMECGGLPPLWRSDPGPVGRHAFSLEALSREKAAASCRSPKEASPRACCPVHPVYPV